MSDEYRALHILCGNAAFNRGDRINLISQIALLREHFPNAEISVSSYRAEVDRGWYDATVIQRGKFFFRPAELKAIRKADIVIWGGGALLADNSCRTLIPLWLLHISFIRCVLRKPIMAWAHGIVLETSLGRMLAKKTLNLCACICVRDQNSLEQVQKLHLSKECHLTADPAILMSRSAGDVETGRMVLEHKSVPVQERLIGIVPTFWPFYYAKNDIIPYMILRRFGLIAHRNETRIHSYLKGISAIIDDLHTRHPHRNIVLIPRYASPPWQDVQHLRRLKEMCAQPSRIFIIEGDDVGPCAYAAMWHHLDFMISTAMHDAILSAAMNVPFYQLYYESKGKDFHEKLGEKSMGRSWDCLFDSKNRDWLLQDVHDAFTMRRKPDEAQIRAIESDAEKNVLLLEECLKSLSAHY